MNIAQCTHLITGDPDKAQDSYKCRTAQKLGVPILSTQYIVDCVEKAALLDTDPYVLFGKTKQEEFSSGKIVGELKFLPLGLWPEGYCRHH